MSVIRGVGVESNKATKGSGGGRGGVGWLGSTIISTQTRQVLLSKDYITPTYILLHQTTFHENKAIHLEQSWVFLDENSQVAKWVILWITECRLIQLFIANAFAQIG